MRRPAKGQGRTGGNGQKGKGWPGCFSDTVEWRAFLQMEREQSECLVFSSAWLERPGAHMLPTMPQGRIHVYWGLLWPQDLSRTPLGGSEGHHGTCFALLLTGRARSGVPGWRMGAALSVEVGPGSWWGLVMVNMLICSSGYVNSTTVGTAV